jgi:hypothetical protein
MMRFEPRFCTCRAPLPLSPQCAESRWIARAGHDLHFAAGRTRGARPVVPGTAAGRGRGRSLGRLDFPAETQCRTRRRNCPSTTASDSVKVIHAHGLVGPWWPGDGLIDSAPLGCENAGEPYRTSAVMPICQHYEKRSHSLTGSWCRTCYLRRDSHACVLGVLSECEKRDRRVYCFRYLGGDTTSFGFNCNRVICVMLLAGEKEELTTELLKS